LSGSHFCRKDPGWDPKGKRNENEKCLMGKKA
jgi:hypothetical protein